VVMLSLAYGFGALPESQHFGVVAMLIIDVMIAAALITAWRYGLGVRKAFIFTESSTWPEHIRDGAFLLSIGAVGLPVAMGLFIPIENWLVIALLIVVAASWAALRLTRPNGPDRVYLSTPESWRARPAITMKEGAKEQRLAAYLCFFIPLVSIALLFLVTAQLAPAFALIGFVSAICGAAMEYYLWSVQWTDEPADTDTANVATTSE
ncbi:MAG: hypothetical protein AAFO75_06655, partial [Pseudomonadota bacterium]